MLKDLIVKDLDCYAIQSLWVKFFLDPNDYVLYIHIFDETALILKILNLGRCIIHEKGVQVVEFVNRDS